MNENDMLFVEAYRPTTVEDCILPDRIKTVFREYVKTKEIPHILISGNPGSGKTSIAKALCNDVGCDYLFINGSDENGIDTFRNKIKHYASSLSLSGGRKVIIIDEADYLNCLEENETVLIATDDGNKKVPLNELEFGIEYPVVSFNMETMFFEDDIGWIVADSEKAVFEVTFDNDPQKTLKVTADHPFIVYQDEHCYERAINDNLIGSEVISSSYELSKVTAIKYIGIRRVINLEVKKNHTFVAGPGLVVHNCNSIQPALRSAMEEFSKNTSFIFTCNYPNKIIAPIHSRCSVVDFTLKNSEKASIAKQFLIRIRNILQTENIQYDDKVVAEVIKKHFPDFRRVINELQKYSKFGAIDTGILGALENTSIDKVIQFMKNKDFRSIRGWAASGDYDSSTVFKHLYDELYAFLEPQSIPQAVIIIADYDYKANFVSNKEINLVACLTNLMVELEFKQ